MPSKLGNFIKANTAGCESVVEFGSMHFIRLDAVHPSVQNRIGIEIHKPYIDCAKFTDCTRNHGDMCNFETLVVVH